MKYLIPIFESKKDAKNYLNKRHNDKYDEQFEVLSDRLKKYPNLILPFVKMVFDRYDKNKWEMAMELISLIDSDKGLMKNLPKNINQYKDLENLYDDIFESKENKKIYQFINSLYSEYRNYIKNNFEQYKDILKAYINLPEESYKNFAPLKYFKEEGYSPKEYIEALKEFIEKEMKTEVEIREYIKNHNIEVIWDKNNVLVVKTDDRLHIKTLGSSNWCIVYSEASFDEYLDQSEFNTQYIIYDFNKELYRKDSLFGITIDIYDEPVEAGCQNKADEEVDFIELLDSLGIPKHHLKTDYKYVIDNLNKAIKDCKIYIECKDTRMFLYTLFKHINVNLVKDEVLVDLIETWFRQYPNIIAFLKDIEKLDNKTYLSYYLSYLMHFDHIVGNQQIKLNWDKVSYEDIKNIDNELVNNLLEYQVFGYMFLSSLSLTDSIKYYYNNITNMRTFIYLVGNILFDRKEILKNMLDEVGWVKTIKILTMGSGNKYDGLMDYMFNADFRVKIKELDLKTLLNNYELFKSINKYSYYLFISSNLSIEDKIKLLNMGKFDFVHHNKELVEAYVEDNKTYLKILELVNHWKEFKGLKFSSFNFKFVPPKNVLFTKEEVDNLLEKYPDTLMNETSVYSIVKDIDIKFILDTLEFFITKTIQPKTFDRILENNRKAFTVDKFLEYENSMDGTKIGSYIELVENYLFEPYLHNSPQENYNEIIKFIENSDTAFYAKYAKYEDIIEEKEEFETEYLNYWIVETDSNKHFKFFKWYINKYHNIDEYVKYLEKYFTDEDEKNALKFAEYLKNTNEKFITSYLEFKNQKL
jgi:hypothetical protein